MSNEQRNDLTIREVTRENWQAALRLAVHPDQQRFIPMNQKAQTPTGSFTFLLMLLIKGKDTESKHCCSFLTSSNSSMPTAVPFT